MSLAVIETVKSAIITEIDSYLTAEKSKYSYHADAKQTQDYMTELKKELCDFKPNLSDNNLKEKLTTIINKYKISKVNTKSTAASTLSKILTILEESFRLYKQYKFALITQEQLNNSKGLNIVNQLINDYLLIKAVEKQHANDSILGIGYSFITNSETARRKQQIVETLISEVQQLEERLFNNSIDNETYQDQLSLRLHEAKKATEKEGSGGILIPLLEDMIENRPNIISSKMNDVKSISFAFLNEKSIADKKEQASKDTPEEESEESEQEEILATTSAKKELTETTPAQAMAKNGAFASKEETEKPLTKAQKKRAKREQQAATTSLKQ